MGAGLCVGERGVCSREEGLPFRILKNFEFYDLNYFQTSLRIDVHGKENSGLLEKLVSIFGKPDSCTRACQEIMACLHKSQINNNARIIGRDGRGIRKVREDSEARISISNVQEMASLYPDRVITIRGTLESMSLAESAISERLRECYRKEEYYYARQQQQQLMPSTSQQRQPTQQQPHSICHIGIPNFAVGAIIGAAGANIKRIIRDSNALVTVEARRDEQTPADERIATVKGTPDSCWRASYYIFEKMKQEGFGGSDGEVRLRTIITIPRSAAGRVVGKGGKCVREIQRLTGAMIRLAVDASREQQQQQQQISPPQQQISPQQQRLTLQQQQQQQQHPQFSKQFQSQFQQLPLEPQQLPQCLPQQQEMILQQQRQHYQQQQQQQQQQRQRLEELVLVEIFGNFISTQVVSIVLLGYCC
ncbi:hypothetical protein HELRODRAFT_181360 [Helobdella robusta]|uniref:K Homology domain-containing protein n=1 Tax=Helobdella robusta TaxID=6412 RepID=T1FGX4_HELRO|nr:hypothetical protein HELRODRAFT_181360 [Helobdella robusta]ESN92488.1 hypothetical protein HELRODRAFT_181360 [Helobdella robusta]